MERIVFFFFTFLRLYLRPGKIILKPVETSRGIQPRLRNEGNLSMHFTSFLQDRQLTVALTGEIDHHCAKEYIQQITAKIDAYMPAVCVLDFQEVTFMDSSGIAVVINALRHMAQIGGRLRLQSIAEQPMKVLRAAGIEKIVEIREAVR